MAHPVTLRSKYLQEAALLLAVSAPSASAFLGSARDRLIDDTETEMPARERDALRRETCSACGASMIPGWSCEVSHGPVTSNRGHPKQTNHSNRGASGTSVVYTCLRCHRETLQLLQRQPRRQLKRPSSLIESKPAMTSGKETKEMDQRTPKTANASSKQRQKARKGGLQAMLEKNKTQKASQGLDLMDFAM